MVVSCFSNVHLFSSLNLLCGLPGFAPIHLTILFLHNWLLQVLIIVQGGVHTLGLPFVVEEFDHRMTDS